MNYLIMEDFSGRPAPFIFPRKVDHADMRDQLPYGRAISGGQVELLNGEPVCHGGCAALGLSARPAADSAILRAALAPDSPDMKQGIYGTVSG